MRWLRPLLVSALAILFAYTFADAQQNQTPQRPQGFAAAIAKAAAACNALWADHAFDPLRDKFPIGGKKATFAMLSNQTRLLPKDKPLVDLVVKTREKKCKPLYLDAIALLPAQMQTRARGFLLEEDSLNAELYDGKITIGEFNVAMNRFLVEASNFLMGDVRPAPSEVGPNPPVAAAQTKKPLQSQTTQPPIFHQTRLALVIGNGKYVDLPKLTNPINDARAVADTLRDLGFDVTLVTDVSEQSIRRAARKFADQSGQADLGLVYYAGHGSQINGKTICCQSTWKSHARKPILSYRV
jgi:hypothetical protein